MAEILAEPSHRGEVRSIRVPTSLSPWGTPPGVEPATGGTNPPERDMSDLTERLEANRAAVGELIRASKCVAATWTTPTAPGKWSPAQIVEHVALSLEEGAKVVEGEPSKLPRVPLPLRPVARMVLFKRVLRRNRFAKAKTNPEMDPLDGPASPEEARRRLEAACDAFEAACRTYATRDGRLRTPFFGTVDLDDYVRFTELHTRHHCRQMPTM